MVGADLKIMKKDAEQMRNGKPWFFTNLSKGNGVEEVARFLELQIPSNLDQKNNNEIYIGFNKKLRLIQNEIPLVYNFYFIP